MLYGIDISVYEIMAYEESQKQSSCEHPGIGVWEVIEKEMKVNLSEKKSMKRMEKRNNYNIFQKNIWF